MDRRTLIVGGLTSAVTRVAGAEGQDRKTARRVGILTLGRFQGSGPGEGFRQGFVEHGYVEGRNLIVDIRAAHGDHGRLPGLAAELVRSGVEVMLVVGPAPIHAARQATATVPIVMAASSADPVSEGLVASLSRPGGNITGLTYAVSADRFGKQLELLKAAAPRASRIAVLWDLSMDHFRQVWAAPLRQAAEALRFETHEPVRVHGEQALPGAFAAIQKMGAHAVLVATGGVIFEARARVGALAIQHGFPTMAAFKEFPSAGGLMSYGPDLRDLYRRAARYVARILNGARPGDLPIEQPTKYELIINLRTARTLGLTVPASLILQADQTLEWRGSSAWTQRRRTVGRRTGAAIDARGRHTRPAAAQIEEPPVSRESAERVENARLSRSGSRGHVPRHVAPRRPRTRAHARAHVPCSRFTAAQSGQARHAQIPAFCLSG
ncbi:MAG TPA: ABC transporter substrate-binding protein [Candidatus Tectomicrobia bacterium]|nr:ABC transporter substrate-binding protein [Candidatus Tectomicrobia bacterium]